MNKITKMFAITLPLTFCLQNGVANAAIQPIGTLPLGPSQFTETETGPFNDIYTFDLTTASHLDINYHDLVIGPDTQQNHIPDLNASLYLLGGETLVQANLAENNATNLFNLAAGFYELHINGNPVLAGLNHSTFDIRFNVTPVPEPEAYGMVLAGLGLMGFMARRRRVGSST